MLGLVVLAWALLVSPLLHTVAHSHGHRHHHGAPDAPAGPHAAGSAEHLGLVALEGEAAWSPPGEAVDLDEPPPPAGLVLAVAPPALVEQPQGP